MSFLDGYTPMRANRLSIGTHKAKIVKVNNGYWKSGDRKVDVILEIDGSTDTRPNIITINDRPQRPIGKMTLEKSVELWCRKCTEFFDAFGITSDFGNFRAWIGHTGTVTCRQKKNSKYRELLAGEQDSDNAPNNNGGQWNSPTDEDYANSYAQEQADKDWAY